MEKTSHLLFGYLVVSFTKKSQDVCLIIFPLFQIFTVRLVVTDFFFFLPLCFIWRLMDLNIFSVFQPL